MKYIQQMSETSYMVSQVWRFLEGCDSNLFMMKGLNSSLVPLHHQLSPPVLLFSPSLVFLWVRGCRQGDGCHCRHGDGLHWASQSLSGTINKHQSLVNISPAAQSSNLALGSTWACITGEVVGDKREREADKPWKTALGWWLGWWDEMSEAAEGRRKWEDRQS